MSIELAPSQVELCGGPALTTTAIVRNGAAEALEGAALDWVGNTGLAWRVIEGGPLTLPRVESHAAHVWRFETEDIGGRGTAGKMLARLQYRRNGVPEVVTAALEVKRPDLEKLEKVAKLETRFGATGLDESRPAIGYLVATNTAIYPLTVEIREASAPGLEVRSAGKPIAGTFTLAPGDALVRPLEVSVKQLRNPGRRAFTVEARIGWSDGRCPRSGTLVAVQEVDVGLLAQSEILTVLGIPSLLVLPGMLAMIVVGVLWRVGGLRLGAAPGDFPFTPGRPEFWLLAVSISFVAVLGAGFLLNRPYLEVYNLIDVMRLWFGSVVGAAAGYLLLHLVVVGTRRLRVKCRERHHPLPDDQPSDVLRKMARAGQKMYLERVNRNGVPAFRFLPRTYPPGDRTWIVPPIRITLQSTAPKGLMEKIEALRTATADPGALADLLATHATAAKAEWLPGALRGPELVPETELTDPGGRPATAPLVDEVQP